MPGDDPNRAFYLLGHLGLSGMETPQTLSGGEARRAALARVLAPRPDILLLDEPTNNLDPASRAEVLAAIRDYEGAIVLVTHELDIAHCANRIIQFRDGCVILDQPVVNPHRIEEEKVPA